MATAAIGITVFNDPKRLRKLLEALERTEGLDEFGMIGAVPVRVFEDPWIPKIEREYRAICNDWNVPYDRLPEWGCMQGSFRYAVEHTPEDWFIYLPDDVLPTPGTIANVFNWIWRLHDTNVSAFQIPYWNADELPAPPWNGGTKDFMWEAGLDWLDHVPRNPQWQLNGVFPIVNLNGAGFAIRTAAFREFGGNSLESWMLDEDASARIWTMTDGLIVAVPGKPLVHYMGASQKHPPHHFHCLDCWERAGWPRDKDGVLHPRIRGIIRERTGFGRENEYDGEKPWEGGMWK